MERPLFDNSSLSPEMEERVRAELDKNEQLLWVGQPRPDLMARKGIIGVIIGIPFTAFAIFWVSSAAEIGGGFNGMGCFPLFGIPFIIIGLGLMSAPFWLYRQAKSTWYAQMSQKIVQKGENDNEQEHDDPNLKGDSISPAGRSFTGGISRERAIRCFGVWSFHTRLILGLSGHISFSISSLFLILSDIHQIRATVWAKNRDLGSFEVRIIGNMPSKLAEFS
jgi:hypothetical protein